MKQLFSRIKTHFSNWRDWEMNPVVVKELRQSVRSWSMTGMLLLFLVVLFCTGLAFLVSQTFEVSANQLLGARVFSVFLGILTVASLLFIPLYVGVRLAAERQESNLDLLYITTLSPARIIRGKFLCGAYMTVLFFSACMPFMVFTNLLRGIDLPTVFFILVCLFMVVCVAIQVAIFFACLPISKLLKILVALFGVIATFGMVTSLVGFFVFTMGSGIGSTMGTREFWTAFSTVTGLILAAVILLYLLSVALISPVSANRAPPLRIYITFIWIVGGVLCFYWTRKEHDVRLMLPWAIATFVLLSLSILVVISNHDQLSLRVRRKIPVHPLKRALAFLFFNGAAGGLVWVGLIVATTFVVTWGLMHLPLKPLAAYTRLAGDDLKEFSTTNGAVLLYIFAYALTALFIQRRFLGRRSPKIAGILTLLLPGAWALAPNIAFFVLNRLSWKTVESNQLGNIFNVFIVRDINQKRAHLICATAWLVLMLILNAKWFVQQIKEFKPLERRPQPQPPLPATPPPVVSTAVNVK